MCVSVCLSLPDSHTCTCTHSNTSIHTHVHYTQNTHTHSHTHTLAHTLTHNCIIYTHTHTLIHNTQLADVIVNNVCQIVMLEGDNPTACQAALLMLTGHHLLHKPILVRLWELLHSQVRDNRRCLTCVALIEFYLQPRHHPALDITLFIVSVQVSVSMCSLNLTQS